MIILLLLVHATYIWVLFFAHIPFVVNRTFNATPMETLQQLQLQLYWYDQASWCLILFYFLKQPVATPPYCSAC